MNIRIVLLASVAIAVPQAAFAEQRSGSTSSGAQQLEEVVVTAQRRSERLQDVPMSITALSAETLTKSGVTNTADLARVVPGLIMATYSNNLQPAIRGVTATGGNTGDNPSVAMYLDGVYQAQQVAALMDLPDAESVQVLKGPQGTLYGQNATGGAIIITTAAPSFTPTGRLSASYGNYNAVDLRGFVSGPILGDKVAASIAAGFQDRGGFRRNLLTGKHDDGLNSKLVRGKLLFKPTDSVSLTLIAYHSDRDDSANYAQSALNSNSIGYLFAPTAPRVTSSKQYASNPAQFNRVMANGVSAKGEVDLEAGTLTVSAAHALTKVTAFQDLDSSPVNFNEYHWVGLKTKTFVSEATFASRKFGRVSFVAGALYLDGRDCFCNGLYVQRDNSVGVALSQPTFQVLGLGVVDKTWTSAYGEVTFDATDSLVLTAGGRYSHETQRGYADQVAAVNPTRPVPLPYPGNPVKASKFSPRLTARYKLSPEQNVYASYTQGFKGGLINTANLNQKAVEPETIKAYEVGYKGRLAPNLTVNLSAFLYNYSNLQVVSYQNSGSYITQNAASARGKGVEFDATWAVTPELTLSGGVAYLDAKYRRFPNAQSYVANGFGNTAILIPDHSGARLPRSPKWSGALAANYQTEIEAGTVAANASLYYTDNYGVDPLGILKQGAYSTLSAELSFAPTSMPGLRLVAWGRNLTNTVYISQGQVNDFATSYALADPRTFGVRAEYAF